MDCSGVITRHATGMIGEQSLFDLVALNGFYFSFCKRLLISACSLGIITLYFYPYRTNFHGIQI